jgi:hypothetical protein
MPPRRFFFVKEDLGGPDRTPEGVEEHGSDRCSDVAGTGGMPVSLEPSL